LETSSFITADIAYRRSVLEEVGGFDERFRRAYREDADLALRVLAHGYSIVEGERTVLHPPGAAPPWVSVALQTGNADDALMDALHGRAWRERARAPRGRVRRHVATTAAGLVAAAAAVAGKRLVAVAAGAVWAGGTAELAHARISPGPKTVGETTAMLATSVAIPPAATFWRGVGLLRRRRRCAGVAPEPARARQEEMRAS
jgi:hypothetical protein